MPTVERVEAVTVVPREKYPLGHTTLAVNEPRALTRMWTRRYLREQLLVELAGEEEEEEETGSPLRLVGVSGLETGFLFAFFFFYGGGVGREGSFFFSRGGFLAPRGGALLALLRASLPPGICQDACAAAGLELACNPPSRACVTTLGH